MLGVITLHTFVSVISRVDTLMEDQGLNPRSTQKSDDYTHPMTETD